MINADAKIARNNGVTITVAAGIGHTHGAALENSTEALPDISLFAPINDTTNKTIINSYAKFGPNFAPAYYVPDGPNPSGLASSAANTALPGWVVATTEIKDNPYLPPSTNFSTVMLSQNGGPVNGLNTIAPVDLDNHASWKSVRCVTPYIDYSQINQLNGASGVDVGLALGYKMFINDGVYLHPSVKFGYFNAKSENAVSARYQETDFWTKGINARFVGQKDATPTDPVAIYGIDGETTTSQGFGGAIGGALTFQAQWYWNFITAIGYQLSEGVSVEGQIGYQMTRFKMSVMEVSNEIDGLSSTFQPYNNDSTLTHAFALNTQKTLYNLSENLQESEESDALLISGLYMGVGLNFSVAKNLTLGVNMYHVFNAKRNFSIEDVTISPTVKTTAAAQNTQQQGTQANAGQATTSTTPAAGTTSTNDESQTVSIDAAQDISGLQMALTYNIPVGANECAPAA